ncbi:MAG: tripartite tricarboxylate transporter TctB family protein [Rhodobacterales bacterium]|nr:tripartite tricarboxylate transporter TctB family protein [Rhodobacterales bacterium]
METRTDRGAEDRHGRLVVLKLPTAWFEAVVFVALAATGLWFVIGALDMPKSRAAFDPGTFPMLMGGGLMACSLLQVIVSLRGRSAAGQTMIERPLAVVTAALLLAAFPHAIEALGYYAVTIVWVPVLSLVAGLRSPVAIGITTLIVLFLAKVVFEMTLGTPLP